MEQINKLIERTDLPMKKLSKLSQGGSGCTLPTKITGTQIIKNQQGECFISLYQDEKPRPEDYAMAVKRLSVAFPQQSVDFFKLAVQEMADMGFTRQQMADAVTHLIRTFLYKQPNIADIVSYKKLRRIYTYGQMCAKLVCNGGTEESSDSFSKVEIDGKIYWYLPNENI